MFKVIFCVISIVFYNVQGAKILMVYNAVARSHYILGESLALGLANKGHEVTIISPFKLSKPQANYSEIILDDASETLMAKVLNNNILSASKQAIWERLPKLTQMGLDSVNRTYNHPKVQELIKSGKKFDVFIMEAFLNEGLLGLAHHVNAITIATSPAGTSSWTNKMTGNPFNPAYNLNFMLPFINPMSFKERFLNTLFKMIDDLYYWIHIREFDALYEKIYFDLNGNTKDRPHLSTLVTNVSMVLLNSNIVVHDSRAYVPNMIQVGGLHIKSNQKLPKDLQQILDSSDQGVIYFSMGSNLKSSKIFIEKQDAILKTFANLNQTVLWKWENDNLTNKPKNVIVKSWMPQQSILAHPNVKVFITHGGLLSSMEALHFGVPLIGIPVFGDQPMNMARAVSSGYGIKINLNDISEEILTNALQEALKNPKYRQRALYLSNIFRDENQTPIDRAVSSVEYALRHKGAPFLRSSAVHMPLYQQILLDVIVVLLVLITLPFVVLYWIIKSFMRMLKRTNVSSSKKRN